MKVSESKNCVAYYFKQNYPRIAGPINSNDSRFDIEYMRNYILHLTDQAKRTRTQQRIRNEILSSPSLKNMLWVVDRVINNGDATEFIDYYKT